MLLNFLDNEFFVGKVLVLEEISFLLSLVWTLDIFSLLTLKSLFLSKILLGTNIPNWLITQSILYHSTTFLLVSQSNALIYICQKSISSTDQILIGHLIKAQ